MHVAAGLLGIVSRPSGPARRLRHAYGPPSIRVAWGYQVARRPRATANSMIVAFSVGFSVLGIGLSG